MGNDGGSIPGRTELVKEKKPERKVKMQILDKQRAIYCSLSKEPFKRPLVFCRLGNIYNKSAIVSALVEKKMPKCFSHIKSLKDVKEANICFREQGEFKIMCPITQDEFNGVHKFFANWSCGCVQIYWIFMVLSERALKELHNDKKFAPKSKCINFFNISFVLYFAHN